MKDEKKSDTTIIRSKLSLEKNKLLHTDNNNNNKTTKNMLHSVKLS